MPKIYRFGPFTLDENALELLHDERPLELRRQAYDTLAYLIQHAGRVITKDEFFENVWQGRKVTENSLAQSISDIRRVLGPEGRNLVRTVHGRGFRFEGDPASAISEFPVEWEPPALPRCWVQESGDRAAQAELDREPEHWRRTGRASIDRSAVVVLPFVSLRRSRDEIRFGRGLSEDLIRCLAGWRMFPVIAAGSTWNMDDADSADPSRAGIELAARYVVDGSVDSSEARVRVRVRLTEVTQQRVVWAERYDEPLSHVFEMQDAIAERLSAQLVPELVRAEIVRLERRPPAVLTAWHATLLGLDRYHRGYLDARTVGYLELAREEDPEFILPTFLLGYLHHLRVHHQATDSAEREFERVALAAETCLAIDPRDPSGHLLSGLVRMVQGEADGALRCVEDAVELNPSLADARSLLGQLLAMRGRGDDAVRQARLALRLSPRDPRRSTFLSALAMGHFVSDRYDEAARCAERAARDRPDLTPNYLCIAACAGLMGEHERAKDALEQVHRLHPSYSPSELDRLLVSTLPEIRERFWEGLGRAGFSRS